FTFVNTYNDVWPWFSHQHDAGIENGGSGPMTIFDNGDTRIAAAPLGLGTACAGTGNIHPWDCNSRGMALNVNFTNMTATPVVSLDLGGYSTAMGSAQLLGNGNYFFENPIVFISAQKGSAGHSIEMGPTPAFPEVGPADKLMDQQGPQHYRAFQMANLYAAPTT